MFRVSAFVAVGSVPQVYSPCMLLHFFYWGFYIFSRYEEQEEGDDDDHEEAGEDPYEFSLSAVIDECARMASHEEHAAGSANEASGYAAAKKRKIVQSAYFSDEEDEG